MVASEPAGASVFVDGMRAGETPVTLDALTPGDHRVRLAKDGYLENARVVTVAAGERQRVAVRLTARAPERRPAATAESQNTGSSGAGFLHNKAFVLGFGAAAIGAGAALVQNNLPPVPGGITVSPTGGGLATVTSFTLAVSATDLDGDALTYAWDFGDGQRATGASVTHVYGSVGTFRPTLVVSDGPHNVSSEVTLRVFTSLAGTWRGPVDAYGCTVSLSVVQATTSLVGTMTLGGPCSGTVPFTGTMSPLAYPGSLTFVTSPYTIVLGTETLANLRMSFAGPTNSTGTQISGSLSITTAAGVVLSTPASFIR